MACCFFTIVAHDPANLHLPRLAPRIARHSMVISKLQVVNVDPNDQRVEVCFENFDGTAADDLFVLSLDTLSLLEFKSMRRWSMFDEMSYHCGVYVGDVAKPILAEVLQALVRARGNAPEVVAEYIILESDAQHDQKCAMMRVLALRGCVEQVDGIVRHGN